MIEFCLAVAAAVLLFGLLLVQHISDSTRHRRRMRKLHRSREAARMRTEHHA